MYQEYVVDWDCDHEKNRGMRIYVRRSGSVEEVIHNPWMIIPARSLREIKDEETVGVSIEDIRFYRFSTGEWRFAEYDQSSAIVKTTHPSMIRRISRRLDSANVPHALSNVKYKARVSMDLTNEIFNVKVPLPLHYDLGEVESVISQTLDMKPRVVGFDIEVKATGSFPRPGDPVFIVSLAFEESDGREEVILLEGQDVFDFEKVVKKLNPDYVVGYNSAGFDIPYLSKYVRSKTITREHVSFIPHLDAMLILDQHGAGFGLPGSRRLALDDVSVYLGLCDRSVYQILSIDRSRIYDIYLKNRERVLKYAELDARLTFRLGNTVARVLAVLYMLTGVSPSAAQYLPTFGSLVEYSTSEYLLRRYRVATEVRFEPRSSRELDNGYGFYRSGTKNHFYREGVWRNVGIFDFDRLYPTIYYKYHVDPFTVKTADDGFLVYMHNAETNTVEEARVEFSPGPVWEILRYYYLMRNITKKYKSKYPELDQAIKILSNSAYGALSKTRGMVLNPVCSGFVFYKSSQIFLNTIGLMNNIIDRKVVYGDTDSLFVLLRDGDDPARIGEELNRLVKKRFGEEFNVKYERLCKWFALLRRKTYVCVSDGEVVLKGMEKLELPSCVKDNLEEVFAMAFSGVRDPLKKIIESAEIYDLYIKTSKRLSEIYDAEESRFKEINSNRIKAILVRYLYEIGQRPPELVFASTPDDLDDTPVSARYLPRDRGVIVLLDYTADSTANLECFVADKAVARNKIEVRFKCTETQYPRRFIEKKALEQSRVVQEYIDDIFRYMSASRLVAQP